MMHMIHMIYDTFILKSALASPLLILKIHVEYSYSSWAATDTYDTYDTYDNLILKSAIAPPLLMLKIYTLNAQIRARIAHAYKGTRDAPSTSCAHRAWPKRHARCTINFARASRMLKEARAMHHQCRCLRHNISCDLVNARK